MLAPSAVLRVPPNGVVPQNGGGPPPKPRASPTSGAADDSRLRASSLLEASTARSKAACHRSRAPVHCPADRVHQCGVHFRRDPMVAPCARVQACKELIRNRTRQACSWPARASLAFRLAAVRGCTEQWPNYLLPAKMQWLSDVAARHQIFSRPSSSSARSPTRAAQGGKAREARPNAAPLHTQLPLPWPTRPQPQPPREALPIDAPRAPTGGHPPSFL